MPRRSATRARGRQLSYPTTTGISGASRNAIRERLEAFRSCGPFTDWIRNGNVYRVDCGTQYEADAGRGSVNVPDIAEYVASSAPAHAIDAWSFLARAVEALLRGDRYAAIHLGYYCELRAAMALLAAHGVGVFNHFHTTITAYLPTPSYAVPTPSSGTHQFAWTALKEWSSSPIAGSFLDGAISPAGLELSDWLRAANAGTAQVVAASWFPALGIDLDDVKNDRSRRNSVSYNPLEFCRPPQTNVRQIIDFIMDLWRLFEPGAGRRFQNLEYGLLNALLPSSSTARHRILDELNVGGSYLAGINGATSMVFDFARTQSDVDSASCDLEVLSRAALLLSFATSAVRSVLSEAAFTGTDLQSWVERFARERGIPFDSAVTTSPAELWADVNDTMESVRIWRSETPPNIAIADWRKAALGDMFLLSAFEMAGLWGLVP